MSPDSRIGSALMSRRIELGISLEQAARGTNIRARMIEVLESGDYSQYPPRGHAIGMLSSYARYLGLNSAKIVEAFDEEYRDYEEERLISKSADNTRRGVGKFGERVVGGKSRPVSRESSGRRRSSSRRRRGDSADSEQPSKLSQSLRSEAQAQDDDRYKTGSVRVVGTRQTGTFRPVRSSRGSTGRITATQDNSSPSRSGRINGSTGSMRTSQGTGAYRRTSATGSFALRNTGDITGGEGESTPNFFGIDISPDEGSPKRTSRRRGNVRTSTSDNPRAARPDENIIERAHRIATSLLSERRTRIITLLFAIIVIGVIIAASVLIGTAGSNNTGIIPVQGGAVNDTTTTDGKNAAHKTITTANGNPVIIKVEVPEGETSVIDISFDGANAYKGAAVGPWSKDFNVTESFSASFGNPDVVTITENDNPIDIAVGDDGTGSLYINIQAAAK